MDNPREILVLSRNDPLEAMRVAAGLTIFGHAVSLILMNRSLTESEASGEQAELLELSDIEPKTTVAAMAEHLELLGAKELGLAIANADAVINL